MLLLILLLTISFSTVLAPRAHAWQVVNDSGYTLEASVDNIVLPGFQTFSIASGASVTCFWWLSTCVGIPLTSPPYPVRHEQLRIRLTSDDFERFECLVDMPGDGVVFVKAQTRTPLPDNLYCYTTFNEALQMADPNRGTQTPQYDYNGVNGFEPKATIDFTDPFARAQEPQDVPAMTAANRSVRFLATGDPQYNNSDISNGVNSGRAAQADTGIAGLKQFMRDNDDVRGIIVNGDLTQNARGDDGDIDIGKASDELDAFKGAMGGLRPFFFEGLGNHDVESTGPSSDPGDVRQFVREKPRVTVDTYAFSGSSQLDPHYSWDWHDVHVVQLDVFPGNDSKLGIDPRNALTYLTLDLANTVGNSGRPVILNHHYGFDQTTIDEGWWDEDDLEAYWNAIRQFNVVAIFFGHRHLNTGTSWQNIAVPFRYPIGALARPDDRICIPAFNGAAIFSGNFLDVEVLPSFVDIQVRDASNSGNPVVARFLYDPTGANISVSTNFNTSANHFIPCPEPGQLAMLLPGIGTLAFAGRKRSARRNDRSRS